MGVMKPAHPALVAALLLSPNLFGQAAAGQPLAFHVQGTMTDASGAVFPFVEVKFEGEQLKKTVITNGIGVYESDLPPGLYTMEAISDFRRYHRPVFSVTSSSDLTLDVMLPAAPICDTRVVGDSGSLATGEEPTAPIKEACTREELFTVPSKRGVPFQLYIRYRKRTQKSNTLDYFGETTPVEDPVFVAYNLFSLQADHVTYNVMTRTLEARDNVVEGESGKKYGDWMNFRLENGEASQTGCLCREVPRRKPRATAHALPSTLRWPFPASASPPGSASPEPRSEAGSCRP